MKKNKNILPPTHQLQKGITIFTLLMISIYFIYPAIFAKGLWSSFDSPFHITMIAQFYQALKQGYFPVVWTDGVANYGLPFGIIAHPLTSYSGGIITFITRDPLISYKILWLLFSLISCFGMYRLLARFTGIWPSIAGTILYTFSAYRILNLYVRGALPEFAAAAWLPFLLNALYKEKDSYIISPKPAYFTITFWITLIFFTHPMFIIFSSVMVGLFLVYYHLSWRFWFITGVSILTAILINAFYLLPLNLELKYFYMGQGNSMLIPESSLTLVQFIREQWEYSCSSGDTINLRCNHIQTGLIETIIVIAAPILYITSKNKSRKNIYLFLIYSVFISTLLLSGFVEPVFEKIKILGSIQYIYRFLNIWLLFPPIILAMALESLPRYKIILTAICISGILLLRLPQIYVKNVVDPDRAIYFHNTENIHSVMMSTIWMAESKTYKEQPEKGAIITGNGKIIYQNITPAKHKFYIISDQALRFADYTFFFPGWHAYIDGKETLIQWQDPDHRGYITLFIPAGEHFVETVFTDTKIRLIGKWISIITCGIFIGMFLRNKIKNSCIWSLL